MKGKIVNLVFLSRFIWNILSYMQLDIYDFNEYGRVLVIYLYDNCNKYLNPLFDYICIYSVLLEHYSTCWYTSPRVIVAPCHLCLLQLQMISPHFEFTHTVVLKEIYEKFEFAQSKIYLLTTRLKEAIRKGLNISLYSVFLHSN